MTTNQQTLLERLTKGLSGEQRKAWEDGYRAACQVLRVSGHDGHYHARATEGFLNVFLEDQKL